MAKGRLLSRRENKRIFKRSSGQLKSRFIPGNGYRRGGDPRF